MAVLRMRLDLPNLVHSLWIWTASSRVGARIRQIGPSPGASSGWALMWTLELLMELGARGQREAA